MKKKYVSLFIGMGLTLAGMAQSVTTVAGIQHTDSGRFNATADNPVAKEYYSRPHGISVDNNGRIWVTDEHNIMLIDGGTSRNRGGYRGYPYDALAMGYYDGVGPASRFTFPTGCAVNPITNDLYICDRDNSSIRKGSKFVNSSNGTIVSTYAGKSDWTGGYVDGSLTDARFRFPEDAEFDKNGNLYIVDFMNNCIRKIASGQVSTLAGDGNESRGFVNGKGKAARFSFPSGIGMHSDGSLLVADRSNDAIRKIDLSTGDVTTVTENVRSPLDVLGVDGLIYILESTCIKVFDGNSVSVFAGDPNKSGYKNGSLTESLFRQMYHFDYNPNNQSIYVADWGNNVIRKIPLLQDVQADFYAHKQDVIVEQTVILTNSSKNETSVQWEISPSTYSLQAGSSLTDEEIFVSFSQTGSYTIKLTAKNASGQDVEVKNGFINVSTNSLGKPEVDFTVSNTYPTLSTEQVTFVDLTQNPVDVYKWSISPSTFSYVSGSDASSRNPVVTFDALGLYSVLLEATNSNGNGSKSRTDYIQVVGVSNERFDMPTITVFPNPSEGKFYLKGLETFEAIRIIDVTGRQALSVTNHASNQPLSLTNGLYFIQVKHQANWTSQGKIIIH